MFWLKVDQRSSASANFAKFYKFLRFSVKIFIWDIFVFFSNSRIRNNLLMFKNIELRDWKDNQKQ